MSFDKYSLCRSCGKRVVWDKVMVNLDTPSKLSWRPMDPDTREVHECPPSEVRVYSPAERKRFEEKRLRGEI